MRAGASEGPGSPLVASRSTQRAPGGMDGAGDAMRKQNRVTHEQDDGEILCPFGLVESRSIPHGNRGIRATCPRRCGLLEAQAAPLKPEDPKKRPS